MVKITVSTAYSGRWYSIAGTVSEVRGELNRINARAGNIVFGGNASGTITLFVGSL